MASIAPGLREANLGESNLRSLARKVEEQKFLCATQRDVRILSRAIESFTGLQFVQLLRVTDDEDRAVLSYLQRHEDARHHVNLDWATACSHASRTIGLALLTSSNDEWSRFSSPMLSPASAQFLRVTRPESLSILAERLTCLTLHFDDGENLDTKMRDLSECFQAVFSRAKNMQVVHVGFPIHRPLTLPLESVFHNVTWEKLHAFGVQAWELHADEIIGLVCRHRNLKGLRLRDVHLKDGSMWKEILPVLRNEMHRLEWVSLRRIGYAPAQSFHGGPGAEIPDLPFNVMLDSDSSDDEEDGLPPTGFVGAHAGHQHDLHELEDPEDDGDDEHSLASDLDDDSRMDFPDLDPDTPVTAPWCDCSGRAHLESAEDLGDDGTRPDNATRKKWEKWVLRRCPEHGS